MAAKIFVVILTYNESIHIQRVISNLLGWAEKIIVLDSYSQDDTVEKAKKLGADIIYREFDSYKNQREYAIKYCKGQTEWLLFLDADEYLTENLKMEIKDVLCWQHVSGFYLPRRFIFMNKWIKWGGYYPIYLLRLFRPERAYLNKDFNEHVIVDGSKKYLKHDFVDHNLKGITGWLDKHTRYSLFEAEELKNHKERTKVIKGYLFGSQSERKQWLRSKIWNNLPIMIVRPFAYFIYRYIIRLGFLDGKEGFIYHFLQGFWYWLIIDIKYNELKDHK